MGLGLNHHFKTKGGNWYVPLFVIGGNKNQFSIWIIGISLTLTFREGKTNSLDNSNSTLPSVILTNEQIESADSYYSLHKNHVNKLYGIAEYSYPPSLDTDKNNPSLWKAEHWKWYLDNFN